MVQGRQIPESDFQQGPAHGHAGNGEKILY